MCHDSVILVVRYTGVDLATCFRGKTVLAIGDSTVREMHYHIIYLVTGKYPSPDGIYPPIDYKADFEGPCKVPMAASCFMGVHVSTVLY